MALDEQPPGTDVLTPEEIEIINRPSPPGKRDKLWWEAHPEEREKARLLAMVQVAEGRFGGQVHGRKKTRPAYEIAAARAAVNGNRLATELVTQATDKLLKASDRRDAIKMLFDMELKVRSEKRDEEDHLMKLSGDELTVELMKMLRELTGAEELDDYIDAESEDVGEEIGVSDSPFEQG